MQIELRPAGPGDRAFLEEVYFETQRWIVEALFGWRGDEAERRKFEELYAEAEICVIVAGGIDAGWMHVIHHDDAAELEGIYLATNFQRRGIGTTLISELMQEARAAGKPLRLSTAKINPARALYRRLGFIETGEDRYKVSMEYRA